MQDADPQPLSFLKRSALKLHLYISLFIISWIHASTDPPHDPDSINIRTTFDQFFNAYPLNGNSFRIPFVFSKTDPITFPFHFAIDIWPHLNPMTHASNHRQNNVAELLSEDVELSEYLLEHLAIPGYPFTEWFPVTESSPIADAPANPVTNAPVAPASNTLTASTSDTPAAPLPVVVPTTPLTHASNLRQNSVAEPPSEDLHPLEYVLEHLVTPSYPITDRLSSAKSSRSAALASDVPVEPVAEATSAHTPPASTSDAPATPTPDTPTAPASLTASTLDTSAAPPVVVPTTPCIGSVTARQIEGGGISYNYGYSTLESMLFPLRTSSQICPFIDLRAHRFDNNEYAANAGLGIRCLLKEKAILGLNAYFDYRTDQSRRLRYMQLGPGLEILTKPLDIRINGYLPSHTSGIAKKCVFDQYIGGYVMVRKKIEVPLQGADVEIGRSIFDFRHVELYGATGAYYYRDICQNVFGGKLRFNARVFQYLSLDYMMTCDSVFGTKIQGQVGLTFQFGCKSKNPMQKKLSQPVRRNEIIVLDQYCRWSQNF